MVFAMKMGCPVGITGMAGDAGLGIIARGQKVGVPAMDGG